MNTDELGDVVFGGLERATVFLGRPAADIDCDAVVGPEDLDILLRRWGPCRECEADLDADGSVGIRDLFLLAGWGP